MIPTIGRIVLYTLTSEDAEAINRRRDHATKHMDAHRANANGVMVHVGNRVEQGQQFPMIITRVWGPDARHRSTILVNGTVMLDGSDTYWATSRGVDTTDQAKAPIAGMFRWPVVGQVPTRDMAKAG